jgi:hypothetical protein
MAGLTPGKRIELMPRAKLLFPIGTSVVKVLARSAARRAVNEQLRAQGVRVSHVRYAEIVSRANAYLADHPELYAEALERAQREGLIECDPLTMER